MTDRPSHVSYRDAGVDIDAGNALVERIKPAAKATHRPGVMAGIGGFGGLFDPAAAGYRDPVLVAATDGVGTKLRIAIDTGRLDGIGIDLVAMCVNDLVCQGAEPLFFLDYFATGKLSVEAAARVVEGIAAGCREAGCALIGGETAEMPGMYAAGDFDLAGFAVGAVERGAELPLATRPGDVLIGLPASGVHSNGFSLVRRVARDAGLGWDDPCPFGTSTPPGTPPGARETDRDTTPVASLGAALLAPTRIYVPAALAAIRAGGVRALAHITGGGLTENLPRVLGADTVAAIDLGAWRVPPVFGWLAAEAGLDEAETLRTFNCGIGMVLVVAPEAADAVGATLREAGEAPVAIGELAAGDGPAVRYAGALA